MTKEQAQQKCREYIEEYNKLIADVKSIKNYQYSSYCTDFLRGMNNKKAEAFKLENIIFNSTNEIFDSEKIEKQLEDTKKKIVNAYSELEFIKTKGPFKDPYGSSGMYR